MLLIERHFSPHVKWFKAINPPNSVFCEDTHIKNLEAQNSTSLQLIRAPRHRLSPTSMLERQPQCFQATYQILWCDLPLHTSVTI